MQREIARNLVVDVAYVGNRGVWLPSSGAVNYNANTPQSLLADGIDITTAAGRAILKRTREGASNNAQHFYAGGRHKTGHSTIDIRGFASPISLAAITCRLLSQCYRCSRSSAGETAKESKEVFGRQYREPQHTRVIGRLPRPPLGELGQIAALWKRDQDRVHSAFGFVVRN